MLKPYHICNQLEVGLDEAGRGCYAGPVFAAAVVLPNDFYHPLLDDSKKLTEKNRETLRPIIEKESLYYAVASVDNQEIDKINILQASFKAMHKAIDNLACAPALLLVDGNRFKAYQKIPYQCIVKGDGIYASIAAASVLAKTYRDEHMKLLHNEFDCYDWINNKGYGTASHRKSIAENGLCKYHRKSFNILPVQTAIF